MGEGRTKRPPAALRAAKWTLRALLILLFVLLAILLSLRAAAAWREGEAEPPAGLTYFDAPGARVAARVSGPATGTPVILVHGTAAWSGFWSEVADHLARRGFRVVAVDVPPFGWSGRDPAERYDRGAQAQRLAAVAAALGRPPVVVAHSFGAGPATEFALREPRMLQGLVLVDAALGQFDAPGEAPVARALRVQPLAELTTAATMTNPAALGPLLRSMIARKDQAERWLPVLRQPMRREGATPAYAAWLPNLFAAQDGALSRRSVNLRRIQVPVALIWGEADTVTPPEQGRRLRAMTRARSLRMLPGIGHIPHIEDPQAFRLALDGALADVMKEGE